MKQIDYYFWMNSDWAYLGAERLERIAADHGMRIRYMPIDLPDVYRRTGGQLLGDRAPERQAYRITELKRWCRMLDIHVNPTPKYMCPNADAASLIVIAAAQMGLAVAPLYKAILHAEWCDERDISDPAELRHILLSGGFDANMVIVASEMPEIGELYRHFTDEAVKAGVFGSPSYVFNNELFWGQDRLTMLEAAIIAASGGAAAPSGGEALRRLHDNVELDLTGPKHQISSKY